MSGSLRALEWLRGFGATTLVPGHGPVSGAAPLEDVAAYLRTTGCAVDLRAAPGDMVAYHGGKPLTCLA